MTEMFRTVGDKLMGLPAPGEGLGGIVDDDLRLKHEDALERAHQTPEDPEVVETFNGEVRARWKIEVTFVKNRTMKGLNAVGIQVWESGKHFHGGGDALAFYCLDSRDGHDEGCGSIIPQDDVAPNGIAYCRNCRRAINAQFLANIYQGNAYMDSIARQLTTLFHRLNSNADILIKYHKTDVRYIALERAKGPDVAARLKGMHIYPLRNIIKDTSNGADLYGRIKAFITS
jgi:hypothetical protein